MNFPAGRPENSSAGTGAMNETGEYKRALFAGGCFWCMEPPFDRLDGVISTVAGYTGGRTEAPTYRDVCTGRTGHLEAVEVIYDPDKVSYENLLEAFWKNIAPTQKNGQFADIGSQYRSAIFYHDEHQRRAAETSKKAMDRSGKFTGPIVTEVLPAGTFWPAEDYHQDYYRKYPQQYTRYRRGSGRDGYLAEIWGKYRLFDDK